MGDDRIAKMILSFPYRVTEDCYRKVERGTIPHPVLLPKLTEDEDFPRP